MLGFALDAADWAAICGALILVGRILYLLARFVRRWVTDADAGPMLSPNGVFISGAAVAVLLVAFAIRLAEQFPALRPPTVLYAGSVVLGFILGMVLDFLVDLRLTLWADRLRALHIPRYRLQLTSTDPALRLEAVRKLLTVGMRAAPALPELLQASRDEAHEVRAYALLVLGATLSDDAEIARAARSALHDPEAKVRAAAAVCLTRFGHPPAELLPALTEGLREPGHQVALSSMEAIRNLGEAAAAAVPAIREVILTAGPPNAADAVQALGKMGPAGVPVLIEVLESGEPMCRRVAVYALEEQGEAARPALAALRKAAAGSDTRLQELARRALRRLGADRR